jgi:nitrate reductase NapAB chaperone NapD
MITAIVSIVVDPSRIPEVAEAIVDIDGIEQVYSVTGDVDLIAVARVRDHEDLAGVIAGSLSRVEGVLDTTTNIAFKTYSKRDLDAAFDPWEAAAQRSSSAAGAPPSSTSVTSACAVRKRSSKPSAGPSPMPSWARTPAAALSSTASRIGPIRPSVRPT